jgi:hypothetical protein
MFPVCCLSGSYLACTVVSSWTLVSVVFTGCCLSDRKLPLSVSYPYCVRMVSSWSAVIVGTRVFAGCCLSEIAFVRELPLCLHGAIVRCCHCRVLCSLGIARQ